MDSSYQKKKKRKELIKKIAINAIIWLVIITFVATIGVTWSNQRNFNAINVAQINNKMYTYYPGSTFFYLYNNVRQSLDKKAAGQMDPEALTKYAVNYSVQSLLSKGILYEFAKQIGIKPSKETLRNILEYTVQGRLVNIPDKGLLEYGEMEYLQNALAGESGDLANVLTATPTIDELYSYYDITSISADAEVLYINITNFIASKVSEQELRDFYLKNVSNYTTEVFTEEVSMKSKSQAFELHKYAQENGWQKMLENFKGKYTYINNLTLRSTNSFTKRFVLALSVPEGKIASKPLYENGEYHVMLIKGFPELNTLPKDIRASVDADYVSRNFKDLRVKFDADIKNAISKAETAIAAKTDLKTAGSTSGLTYAQIKSVSPISQVLLDSKSNVIDLPVQQNLEWIDFIFTSEPNTVSKTYSNENYVAIFKLLDKKMGKVDYRNIGQKETYNYLSLKMRSVNKDWTENLKKLYKTKLFEDDLKKIYNKD